MRRGWHWPQRARAQRAGKVDEVVAYEVPIPLFDVHVECVVLLHVRVAEPGGKDPKSTELAAVLDAIQSGEFVGADRDSVRGVWSSLMEHGDRYMVLADFAAGANEDGKHHFGINFERWVSRLNEHDQWQFNHPDSGLKVSRFELVEPSLHDIFVETVTGSGERIVTLPERTFRSRTNFWQVIDIIQLMRSSSSVSRRSASSTSR